MMLAAAAAALAFVSPFPGVAHASLHGVTHRSFHGVAHQSLHARDAGEPEVQLHNVQLQNCPLACEYATSDTSTWTTYHSFNELSLCEDTILFTINVQASTVDPHIKACLTSPGGPQMQAGAFYGLLQNNVTTTPSPDIIPELVVSQGKMVTSQDGSCGASPQETTLEVETRWSGQGSASADKVSAALSQLAKYFRNSASCGRDLMFARSSVDAVVGAFAGGGTYWPCTNCN
jgi:chitinase